MTDRNLTRDELDNRFSYHPPEDPETVRAYEEVRAKAKQLAEYLNDVLPVSQEAATAFSRLDEVVFFANAAIARHELRPVDSEPIRMDDLRFSSAFLTHPNRVQLTVLHRPTGLIGAATRNASVFPVGMDPVKDPTFVYAAITALRSNMRDRNGAEL